ncbi:MAG: branched-chain amino acid ABC transporter permease [Inquilinaceae bacterium]
MSVVHATAGAEKPRAADWRAFAPALAIFAVLAAIPPLAHLGAEGYILSVVTRVMILALAAISLDLLIGYGGMISFGHAAFLGIGAYATGILITEGVTDAIVILAVVLAAAALFALLTGIVCLRTSGAYFIMITLAFGQMLFFAASSLSSYGGDDGLTLWERASLFDTGLLDNDISFYYVTLVVLIGGFALVQAIVGSRFGRVLRAAKENPTRVGAVGVDVFRVRLTAYVIAGMIAGVAGFLLANQAEFVSPATMSWQRSGELIIMVVLGGMGWRNGAILGAVTFIVLEETLSSLTHDWKLIFGPLLILVVLYARNGLAGIVAGLSSRRGTDD